MGNEGSTSKELTKPETNPDNQENGPVKAISVNITSKGSEKDANGEAEVQKNGGPPSAHLSTESTDSSFVVVEADCQRGNAPIISEILEVMKSSEEKVPLFSKMFKKKTEPPAEVKSVAEPKTSNTDPTAVSVPSSDPEPESDSSGEEAAAMIITEHVEDSLRRKVDISTQTDRKSEADISTQTGEEDGDVVANTEGQLGEETAATEDYSLSESVVIAEGNHTAGFIAEGVVTFENDVYKTISFGAEPVEVTARYEEESTNDSELEVAVEADPNNPMEGEIVAEEHGVEKTVPLEIYSCLPKVVADCVEAVFADVSESTDFIPANTSKQIGDEVFTEDNGRGARHMLTDIAVIESNAANVYKNMVFRAEWMGVTDHVEIGHVRSYRQESMNETESEVTAGSNPDKSVLEGELAAEENNVEETVTLGNYSSLPKVVADCIEAVFAGGCEFSSVENSEPSSDEVFTEDNGEGATDVSAETAEPETNGVTPEAKEGDGFPSLNKEPPTTTVTETISEVVCEEPNPPLANQEVPVEEGPVPVVDTEMAEVTAGNAVAAEREPGVIEEFIFIEVPSNENTLNSPDVEVIAKPVPDSSTDVIADVAEARPSCLIVGDNADVPVEIAIDVLSQEFSALTRQEPAADIVIPLEEEVIAATVFVPFSGEKEAKLPIPEEPRSVETNEEAAWTSNEIEAVPVNKKAGMLRMDAKRETEPSVKEELGEENIAPAGVATEGAGKDAASVFAVEEHTGSSPVTSREPVGQSTSLQEPLVPLAILHVTEYDVRREIPRETEDSEDVLGAVVKNSEVSQIAIWDETVVKCVDAEITAEECDLMTLEEVTQEVNVESEPRASVREELIEESIALAVAAVVEQTGFLETQVLVAMPEVTEEDETANKKINSAHVLATSDKNSKDSPSAVGENSEKPQTTTKCFEDDLETIVAGIVTEDCNLVTPAAVTPEVVKEGDAVSRVNSADSTQSAGTTEDTNATRADMEDLLVRLQSASDRKQESQSLAVQESVTPEPEPQGNAPKNDDGDSHQEESVPEENPVMNFFKTFVTTTKTAKKETSATPDATKDQSQKEKQPAAATTVAQVSEPPAAPKGMTVPPPPPPEPPRTVITAEPAAKPAKPTPKEEPKAAAKEPESSKGKSAKETLNKFFRQKKMKEEPQPAAEVQVQPVVEVQEAPAEEPVPVVDVQSEKSTEAQGTAEEAQPVVEEQKVDPTKTETLEAAPKPEPPPPVQEEKKTPSKAAFLSLFKPKAADPNKAAPAPPAAAAEAAPTAKEEPKAAAKSPEVAVSNKPAPEAPQAGDAAAKAPKRLEKRNSVQLFFKTLSQRRSSTDPAVRTEPVATAPGAEKAK